MPAPQTKTRGQQHGCGCNNRKRPAHSAAGSASRRSRPGRGRSCGLYGRCLPAGDHFQRSTLPGFGRFSTGAGLSGGSEVPLLLQP